jgi:putative membrane protein
VPLTLVQRGLAGAAGGLMGASAMNAFARVVALARGGFEARGAAAGVDRDDRGVQPPQAIGAADEDATIIIGRGMARQLCGHEPSRGATLWLGTFTHMGFGAAAGATYGLLSARMPAIRAGYGLPYGAAVWAVADEGAVPALGLSRRPQELSPGIHLYALAGHFVYATALESVLRLAQRWWTPADRLHPWREPVVSCRRGRRG